jgi:large subunit ribosomal protein L15
VKLHDLQPTPGSRPAPRRVGRGHGSGRGKTAGRGTKGQRSRSGGNLPAWFEGGQTPIHVRTPKLHGFKNRFRVDYAPINLARLSDVAAGTLVTPDALVHDGLLSDTRRPLKILGGGAAPRGVTIHAHAFSRSALDKLEAAGSTAQRISWPENLPVDADAEAAEAAEPAAETDAAVEPAEAEPAEATAAGEPEMAEATAAEPSEGPSAAEAREAEPAEEASAEAPPAEEAPAEAPSEPPKRRSRARANAPSSSTEASGDESEPPA